MISYYWMPIMWSQCKRTSGFHYCYLSLSKLSKLSVWWFFIKFWETLWWFQVFQPVFIVILGDFNARSKSWWSGDSTKIEGTRFLLMVSINWYLNQLIYCEIRCLALSCIDLIFTDKRILVVDNGIHPTLQENFHHQRIHCKLNLNIVYPPPYGRLVWVIKELM